MLPQQFDVSSPGARPFLQQRGAIARRSMALGWSEVLVSMTIAPMLVVWQGARWAETAMQALGQSSEEIWRGDRLPLIPFPEVAPPSPDVEPKG